MKKTLTLLTLSALSLAGAQASLSGPDEARQPRSAEAFALGRAVCAAQIPLGNLSGCTVNTRSAASPLPILSVPLKPQEGKGSWSYVPARVLYGSFTRPNAQDVLAQFCTETDTCRSDAVLLTRQGTGWRAVGVLPGFDLDVCLTYPATGGTDAAACLARDEERVSRMQVFRWVGGKAQVQKVAAFRPLSLTRPDSAQCKGGWEVTPNQWHDRDRNVDGRPDLTLNVGFVRYPLNDRTCTMERAPRVLSQRFPDLAFYWDGSKLNPSAQTRDFLRQYGEPF
ncbi:hypothetical protein ACTQ9L_11880 [Deinococcus wulumuqiensis]